MHASSKRPILPHLPTGTQRGSLAHRRRCPWIGAARQPGPESMQVSIKGGWVAVRKRWDSWGRVTLSTRHRVLGDKSKGKPRVPRLAPHPVSLSCPRTHPPASMGPHAADISGGNSARGGTMNNLFLRNVWPQKSHNESPTQHQPTTRRARTRKSHQALTTTAACSCRPEKRLRRLRGHCTLGGQADRLPPIAQCPHVHPTSHPCLRRTACMLPPGTQPAQTVVAQ